MKAEQTPEQIAAGLTEAQRRAVTSASFSSGDGAWHPEGWYCHADKRVRYNLCRMGITRDYLRRSNRLTPLGLQVRQILKDSQ
jgi:hypothetical protein